MSPSRVPLVDLAAQHATIREETDAAIAEVHRGSGYILGRAVEEFEHEFAAYCGVKECVGVGSGSDALHLLLRAYGIGRGDEVIVPALTFVATAFAVSLTEATPVLVDVGIDDALLDPSLIEAATTSRTRAIIPVHLYGRPANMRAINDIAARHGLVVIEDAAQAHGATYHGQRCGSLAHAAAFSFYPSKNLGAFGDGGAVVTNDSAVAARLRMLRNCGSTKKYFHDEVSSNSRLDAIHAAVLSVKLKHLDGWNELRQQHAEVYDRFFRKRAEVRVVEETAGCVSSQHLYVLRSSSGRDRQQVVDQLKESGVDAGIHYPFAIHQLDAYRNLNLPDEALPQASRWAAECFSLPMYPELTNPQLQQVMAAFEHLKPTEKSR